MARKTYTAEQIIGMLREAEVRVSGSEKTGSICRGLGISEQSYYRWRREYGGLRVAQAARLNSLEKENARLRKHAGPSASTVRPSAVLHDHDPMRSA